ncbi:MAG: hypothetical protein QOI95_3922 [Acidimicrobiaceae bacterium]
MTLSRELSDDVVDDPFVVEEAEAIASTSRLRRRRWALVLVLLAFVLSRGIAGYVADHPDFYGPNHADGTGDVGRYDELTWAMRHEDSSPYGPTLRMEYPPAAIPIMMAPRYIRAVSYRTEFIIFMILFDAVGLFGLVRIAKRTGSWWGAVTWFVLIPALGPVAYTRFDIVVAVVLVWAIERALAGRWGHVGLLIALGTAVKLVPALLLPMLFFVAPRDRRRLLVGSFTAGVVVALVPFIDVLPNVYVSVIQYHTERGVQAESIWGAGLLAAQRLVDYPVVVASSHRAWDAVAPASTLLKTISNAASLAVVVGAIGLAVRTRVGDLRRVTLLLFGAMSLLVGVGRVYSPQYVLWLIALGAVAMALVPRLAAPAVGLLAVTTVLAHLEFPIWFWDALFYKKDAALVVLLVRDVLTLAIGALALWAWKRAPKEQIVLVD